MEMNKYINHILLRADVMHDKIETLCAETREYDSASIYANSYWVSACAGLLKGTSVRACTVIGFPLEAMSTKTKVFEIAAAIADGAKKIDIVLNIGEIKTEHYNVVRADVKAVMGTAEGNYVKAILENCLLTKEEIVKACELCAEADAALARTSTGFSTSGVTPGDTKLMKDIAKGHRPMKAAGGVRCYEDMEEMVEVGADRIGMSTGMKLMQRETSDGGY